MAVFQGKFGLRIPDGQDIGSLKFAAEVGTADAAGGFQLWDWSTWAPAPAGWCYTGTDRSSIQGPGGSPVEWVTTTPIGGNSIHALQIVFYGTNIEYYVDGGLFQSYENDPCIAPQTGNIVIGARGTGPNQDPAGTSRWDVDYVRWTTDITAY